MSEYPVMDHTNLNRHASLKAHVHRKLNSFGKRLRAVKPVVEYYFHRNLSTYKSHR